MRYGFGALPLAGEVYLFTWGLSANGDLSVSVDGLTGRKRTSVRRASLATVQSAFSPIP